MVEVALQSFFFFDFSFSSSRSATAMPSVSIHHDIANAHGALRCAIL